MRLREILNSDNIKINIDYKGSIEEECKRKEMKTKNMTGKKSERRNNVKWMNWILIRSIHESNRFEVFFIMKQWLRNEFLYSELIFVEMCDSSVLIDLFFPSFFFILRKSLHCMCCVLHCISMIDIYALTFHNVYLLNLHIHSGKKKTENE